MTYLTAEWQTNSNRQTRHSRPPRGALDSVQQDQRDAALRPAGADTSWEIADKAKREWRKGN
jgi:hypothetical protein